MKRYAVQISRLDPLVHDFLFLANSRMLGIGVGDTEDEAINDFAINNNLRLWNEESPALPSGNP